MASETVWDRRDATVASSHSDSPDRAGDDASPDRRERVLDPGSDRERIADFLTLLEDDHAQRIFELLAEEPRPARDLVELCEASRATVYRRLNRLEELDVVAGEVRFHEDGHHRKVFESTLVQASIELVEGSPEVRLILDEPVAEDPTVTGPGGD